MKTKRNVIKILGIVAITGMFMVGCSQSPTDISNADTRTPNTSVASQSQGKTSQDYIGEEKAKEIMQKKASGAEIVEFEFDGYDDDDNEPATYEGELVKGNIEYEITVDAVTGEVLEFEKDDRDDYDDR